MNHGEAQSTRLLIFLLIGLPKLILNLFLALQDLAPVPVTLRGDCPFRSDLILTHFPTNCFPHAVLYGSVSSQLLFSVMFRISVISLDRIESLAGAGFFYNRARLPDFVGSGLGSKPCFGSGI